MKVKKSYQEKLEYIKNWNKNNKDKCLKSILKWQKNNRVKYNAKAKLNYHIKIGKIKRQPCEVCGSKKSEGHHIDYSQPLKVRWLCHKHHLEEHCRIRELLKDLSKNY